MNRAACAASRLRGQRRSIEKTARWTQLVLERLEDRCLLSDILVASGSTWKYLDDGSDQGTAWQASSFGDSGWRSGPAELGYGDSAEDIVTNTVVSYGPDAKNKYITTYFRDTFNVADPSSDDLLNLGLMRDDGGVV